MNTISKIFKPIVAIFLLALLVACSSDEDPTPGPGPEVESEEGIDIGGDWKTGCTYIPNDKIRIISSFNFSGDSFTYREYLYSDNSCTQFTKTNTFPGTITYHGLESKITSSGKTVYEKDLEFDDGEVWKSLVTLEDDDNTLRIAPGFDSTARPNDINRDNSFKFSKGTVSVSPPEVTVDIDGTWQTRCAYLEEEYGLRIVFKVSGTDFSFRTNRYLDNSCTQSKNTHLSPGKITYGTKLTTPSGLTAYEIDLRHEDGDVWESLVGRQGNKLRLNPDLKGAGRPKDIDQAIVFSKQ